MSIMILGTALLAGCANSFTRGSVAYSSLTWQQLVEVGNVLAQSGESMRAQQYFQQALRSGAPSRGVTLRLLQLYAGDGQYRQAIAQAESYLRAHPSEREMRLFLAALYGALELQPQAVAQYARVLADTPRDADTHFALASALYDSGQDRARADRHFRTYLQLDPRGRHAEEARSLLLTELSEHSAAPTLPSVPEEQP